MNNTVTLFTLSEEIIYNIEVHLNVIHDYTIDSQNSNLIFCKSEIHHNSPYFAMTTIPVIYDESILDEQIILKCNDDNRIALIPLDNTIILFKTGFNDDDYPLRLLDHINPTQNDLDEDIDILLKLILSKNKFSKIICSKYRSMNKFSLRGNPDLEFKYLLFSFKNSGSLYEPSYYFNYTMKLLEFIRREHNIRKTDLFPFLRKFVLLVLDYFRSDGLFGPHAAISFYLYFHYKIHVRCLPFDLKFDDDFHNSEKFDFMNFALIENTISLTSQLALIWGYQSKCHDKFIECVRNLNIKSQYGESFRIMGLRLRESAEASKEDFEKFTKFSREFFPNAIGAHPLSNQLLDYPISLTFIHDLMRIRALVVFPKDLKEVVKFSLPSSMLANVMLDEYITYPENARYDFSNPQVGNYRTAVKKYYNSKKLDPLKYIKNQREDIHQLNVPIITSFYGKTSLYITQFTNQYDFSKVDLHDLMYISVSRKNPYFVLKKGILYRGYNINTNKMKGKDQDPCLLVLAARDILSVEIPKSVTCISDSAFANCQSLCQVTIEENSLLATIKERAFFECRNLKTINLENAKFLNEIHENAFQYSGIEKITFKSSELSEIGEYAFSSCEKLKHVEISGGSHLSIKSFAFYKSPIDTLVFDDTNLNSIYNYAFAKTKLNTLELPESLRYIGPYAFSNCRLTSLSIPKNVNYISTGIIQKNKKLKKVIIESEEPVFFHQTSAIKKFESKNNSNFFSNIAKEKIEIKDKKFPTLDTKVNGTKTKIEIKDNNLKNTKLLKNTTKFYKGAFMSSDLEKFDGSCFEDNKLPKIERIFSFCFAYMQKLIFVDLSDSNIEKVPSFCFFQSRNLRIVKLPLRIKKINRYAFAYTSLSKINLSELISLKEINDYAFYRTKIKVLRIPPSVEYIGSHFYSVSFKKMDDDIFENEGDNDEDEDDEEDEEEEEEEDEAEAEAEAENEYDGEEKEEVAKQDDDDEYEEEEEENEDDDVEEKDDKGKEENANLKEKQCKVVFLEPSRLKTIESYAFYKSRLKKITIPSSVKHINSYAFSKCTITEIRIPKGVRRISDGVFYLDEKLEEIEFEDINNINYIGSSALTGTGLLDFQIPPNISFLPDYCFYNTIINPFDFSNALKLHEIKHNTFTLKKLEINLPLTATDVKDDSFLEEASYKIVDFIGNETDNAIRANSDFNDFDDITFTQDNSIALYDSNINPYSKSEFKETDNGQEVDKCIKCTFQQSILYTSNTNNIEKECKDILEDKSQIKHAIIYLYYEIASKQVTHISLTYVNTILNKLVTALIQIDSFSEKAHECLVKLFKSDKHLKFTFLRENHIGIFNNFIGIKIKSSYSPFLYTETCSICKELNLKILNKPSSLHVDVKEMKKLTTLTSIACAYTYLQNKTNANLLNIEFAFNSTGSERNNLFELRNITKDDFFDLYLFYEKNENKIISKQIIKGQELISNKWFDDYVCINSIPSFDSQIDRISIVHNFFIDYTLRDILDEVMKGKLKEGMKPFKYFMKFCCIEAYIELFMRCADAKYTLLNISSKAIIFQNFDPYFIFIPGNADTDFDIDFELKRFYLLIYELITNQNIDDLMHKVEENKDTLSSYEKLKIKKRDLDGFVILSSENKNELLSFINDDVYQICFNFEKYTSKDQSIKKKEKSFSHLLTKYNKLFINITAKINNEIDKRYANKKMPEKEQQIQNDYKEVMFYINGTSRYKFNVKNIPDIHQK